MTTHAPVTALLLPAFLCAWTSLPAETPSPRLIPSPEPGWPQWRGPSRNGISDETGLLDSWPEAGPPLLWSTEDLGRGYSSPVIGGGRLYITGDSGEELHIFALDLEGKVQWKAQNGRSWRGPYPGARASCTLHADRVYHMNAHGRVTCLDAGAGGELWAVETLERFEGETTTWGLSECLLVDERRVYVTPGGRKGTMAALSRETGETLWATGPVLFEPEAGEDEDSRSREQEPIDAASYASPVLVELDGRTLVIGCSSRHLICVDAATGRLLWKRPVPTRFLVIGVTPVICGGGVFMTAPDSPGGKLYRLSVRGEQISAREVWTATIDTCHGGVIPRGSVLFGSWYRQYNGWGAVDLQTGRTLYRTDEIAKGSALLADGHFYCLSEKGLMTLVRADTESMRIVSRFRLADARRNDAWAHPVILDGRLYLRYHERLQCHDIRKR